MPAGRHADGAGPESRSGQVLVGLPDRQGRRLMEPDRAGVRSDHAWSCPCRGRTTRYQDRRGSPRTSVDQSGVEASTRAWVSRAAPEHQALVPSSAPTVADRAEPGGCRPVRPPTPPSVGRVRRVVGQLRRDGDGVGVRLDQTPEDQVTLGLRAQPAQTAGGLTLARQGPGVGPVAGRSQHAHIDGGQHAWVTAWLLLTAGPD